MNPGSISLAMIAKDEDELIGQCLESVRSFVNEVVVIETNVDLPNARRLADRVIKFEWINDFAAAREFAFAQATGEWILWLDADDLVCNAENLPAVVREAPACTEAIFLKYVYARDEFGNSTCELYRERLIKRCGPWHWRGRVHECMMPTRPSPARRDERVLVLHQHDKRDGERRIRRNIAILEEEIQSGCSDRPGWVFQYLAREYDSIGDRERALFYCVRALEDQALPLDVRYQVQHRAGDILRKAGRYQESIDAETAALRLCPRWADAYLGLAEAYWYLDEWETALVWHEQGVGRPPPEGSSVTINPLDYSVRCRAIEADCLHRVGRHQDALTALSHALAVRPADPKLRVQKARYERALERSLVSGAIALLANALHARGERAKLDRLLDCTPLDLEGGPELRATSDAVRECLRPLREPAALSSFYQDAELPEALWDYPREAIERDVRFRWLLYRLRERGARTVLDCGSGNGWMANGLALHGCCVTGIDLCREAVVAARQVAAAWGVSPMFVEGRVENAGDLLASRRFDAIVLADILEYLPDPRQALHAAGQLLEPAGCLYVTTPCNSWQACTASDTYEMRPGGRLHAFSAGELEGLLAGYNVRDLYREPHPEPVQPDQGWILAACDRRRTRSRGHVVFVVGAQLEEWAPPSLNRTGVGGSETAVVHVARDLQALGFRVEVFNGCGSLAGIYDGVRYRPLCEANRLKECGILVCSRSPEALGIPCRAAARYLWNHDVFYRDGQLTAELAERADGVFLLSRAHERVFRERYPFIPDGKIVLTRNGIDPGRFEGDVERNPYRMVYSSSPDRGLLFALQIFAQVRKQQPQAELHVYYGWEYFDAALRAEPPGSPLAGLKAELTRWLRQPGVFVRGRLPQDRLAAELLQASIWLYPMNFYETSCITAMEMQAAGVVPVTRPYSALVETVRAGVFIDGDPGDPGVQLEYVRAILELWRLPDRMERLRTKARRAARAFAWPAVARQWAGLFSRAIAADRKRRLDEPAS